MIDYDAIVAEVRRLDDWRQRMFAGACAARLAPIVDAIASAETAARFHEGVRAVLTDAPGEVRAMVADSLDAAPELATAHSDEIEYWPKLAVVLVTTALRAGTSRDPGDIGRRACSLSLELMEGVDTMFDHVLRAGPQERAERDTQVRAIEVLRTASNPADAGRRMAGLSAPRVQQLAAVVPEFVAIGTATSVTR
ncbi:hypothetical protein [Asanoa iriomotensis]|uniref:Uncharacterized protein n=1 Tax=Asanoa iriomotensis TaxID=234613 RepID=A0ABQ4C101_9ACTN|nr:hypothetical protein [Asanoa iriomotensis]GIF56448.1 hypothetical protein Air01nite_25430 [Asanoa iriomotensis]